MDKENNGKGNFTIAFRNGVMELRKYTVAAMDKVKADGDSRNDFLLDATYQIDSGVLYITGVSTFTQKVGGGSWGDEDFKCTKKELEEALDLIYISTSRISSKMVKRWFKESEIINTIKYGWYLKKKGTLTEYKTSNFLIIE